MELTIMNYKLKRCPFCNGHDLTLEITVLTYQIKCLYCLSMGPASGTTIVAAVNYWNRGYENPSALAATIASNRNDLKSLEL
jgi:hypothetical protein